LSCACTMILYKQNLSMVKVSADKIRIKDIAALASVSPGTVDRVLHNRGEVAEDTRKHIMEIIENLGYTPNLVAKSLALKKIYRIAVLIPEAKKDNPYWERPRNGIDQAFSEIKDFNAKVELYTFKISNEESFIKIFSKVLQTEPDGIIFNPMFFTSSQMLIKKCEEKDVPYIFIDINIDNCNNLAYYGQDAFRSGYLAAKLMDYSLTDNSDILILKLTQRKGVNHHLIQREKGFLNFFNENPGKKGLNINSYEVELGDDKLLNTVLSQQLNAGNTHKGIFVTNSRVYKVAGYLEKNHVANTLLIGYDLIQENIHYLEKGTIHFLIGQNPEDQGYRSVLALFNHLLLNKPVNKVNYSPIDIIIKENIDYYKNYKM
jgi:LacI family transcriptional regulator